MLYILCDNMSAPWIADGEHWHEVEHWQQYVIIDGTATEEEDYALSAATQYPAENHSKST